MTITRRDLLQRTLYCVGGALLEGVPTATVGSPGGSYVNLQELGGVPDDPSHDNARALNAALERRVRNLYIPPGKWTFSTAPKPITYPMEIVGEGFSVTYLLRRYAAKSEAEALLSIRSPDCRVSRLGIGAGAGTAGGAAIALIADGTSCPDYSVIEDLFISSEPRATGMWHTALLVDGVARSSAPVGVRDIDIRNCYLFASMSAACRINGGTGVAIHGGGLFPAGGRTGRLEITGTEQVRSTYINVDASLIGGISLEMCKYVNVRATVIAGDLTAKASAEDVLISGRCTGNVRALWKRSRLLDPAR